MGNSILDYLLAAFKAIPLLLATGVDITAFIRKTITLIQSWGDTSVPSDADWAELNALITAARFKLHSDVS